MGWTSDAGYMIDTSCTNGFFDKDSYRKGQHAQFLFNFGPKHGICCILLKDEEDDTRDAGSTES